MYHNHAWAIGVISLRETPSRHWRHYLICGMVTTFVSTRWPVYHIRCRLHLVHICKINVKATTVLINSSLFVSQYKCVAWVTAPLKHPHRAGRVWSYTCFDELSLQWRSLNIKYIMCSRYEVHFHLIYDMILKLQVMSFSTYFTW